jgi:alpha-galactosidase
VLLATVGLEAKPLKVFILAGQSNMEGHARVETFDYIGDDPATAPLLKQMRGPDGKPAVADHTWISFLKKNETELISPEEAVKWTRGASNAGYHYMGCAKTFALMGKAFAEANLAMMKGRP